MNKQYARLALMVAGSLMSSLAGAAREEYVFEVSLTIPSRPFYVIPSEPDWVHRTQQLHWDYPSETLSSLRKNFDVRHDTSAIEARLDSPAYLSNGRSGEEIWLRVSFNGVILGPEVPPREVISKEDAAIGKRVLLEIEPVKPAGGYRPGDYSGNVMLLFNARAPGA